MTDVMRAVEKKINEVMHTRAEHLERYCAAFFKQVGSLEASQYELIEEHGQGEHAWNVTWYFRKRGKAQS